MPCATIAGQTHGLAKQSWIRMPVAANTKHQARDLTSDRRINSRRPHLVRMPSPSAWVIGVRAGFDTLDSTKNCENFKPENMFGSGRSGNGWIPFIALKTMVMYSTEDDGHGPVGIDLLPKGTVIPVFVRLMTTEVRKRFTLVSSMNKRWVSCSKSAMSRASTTSAKSASPVM